ncbi:MAG: NADPH-dependent F420 reductase [Phototrophicaceae bacterium]
MKIGIIGTGKLGGALGMLWATKRKHEVFFGSRKTERSTALAQVAGENAHAGTYEEACAFADVVFLPLPWHATEAIVERLAPLLKGKVVVDPTNALGVATDLLVVPATTSGAQVIQSLAPEARVVKAFNAVQSQNYSQPTFQRDHVGQVFYCGDDADAKGMVRELIEDVRFQPIDMGGLVMAHSIEHLSLVWIKLFREGKVVGDKTIINIISR